MELKYYPDRALRRRCSPVRHVDDHVVQRAQEMLELMYASDGIGLAGNQVGWSSRIVTVDVEQKHDGTRIFLNPRVISQEGALEVEEGCLSLPGIRLKVPRAEKITVAAYTMTGERVEMQLEGLASCAWQHEMDHLNGLLIIDKVPPTALIAVRDQLRQLEEGTGLPETGGPSSNRSQKR